MTPNPAEKRRRKKWATVVRPLEMDRSPHPTLIHLPFNQPEAAPTPDQPIFSPQNPESNIPRSLILDPKKTTFPLLLQTSRLQTLQPRPPVTLRPRGVWARSRWLDRADGRMGERNFFSLLSLGGCLLAFSLTQRLARIGTCFHWPCMFFPPSPHFPKNLLISGGVRILLRTYCVCSPMSVSPVLPPLFPHKRVNDQRDFGNRKKVVGMLYVSVCVVFLVSSYSPTQLIFSN